MVSAVDQAKEQELVRLGFALQSELLTTIIINHSSGLRLMPRLPPIRSVTHSGGVLVYIEPFSKKLLFKKQTHLSSLCTGVGCVFAPKPYQATTFEMEGNDY